MLRYLISAIFGLAITFSPYSIVAVKAETANELYAKYWLHKCVEYAPPIENLNEYYCKGWLTTIRYLPLLDKILSGAFESPVRLFPCPDDPRCPDPLPFIDELTKLFGEPQPQPSIVLEAGLSKANTLELAREINRQRIIQATRVKNSLHEAIKSIDSDLELFAKFEKQLAN